MNKTYAAIAFFAPKVVAASSIKELVVDHYVSLLIDEPETIGDQHTMEPLIKAYMAMLDAQCEAKGKDTPDYLDAAEAEKLFLSNAARGYRDFLPNEPDGSESFPWWPDYLPRRDHLYTKSLVSLFGYLAGYHEGRRSIDMYQYFKEEQAEHDHKSERSGQ